ncbi:FAD-dependent oxidoreductase [Nostoc ellipsosporum NOK]|nr:FAD-dependent oxidoreductase [Nostoc ellipsosporum NOK]
MNYSSKKSVIIIGAGASGLMAALELSNNYNVTVLEMHEQPGGRIRTADVDHFPQPVEDGAEFVHGELPLTLDLLQKAGIKYTAIEGDIYRVIDGNWQQEEEMIEGWDELLNKMKKAEAGMTLSAFLDKYYSEEKHRAFRKEVVRYANGFDLADEDLASASALYDEWKNEEETNFRIEGGYRLLIRYMEQQCREKGCRFIYQQTATRVEWSRERVTVFTNDQQSFTAGKLIVTQPVAVLRNRGSEAFIHFDPEPADYITAANDIGAGAVIKLQFLFKTPFWKERHGNIGFLLSDEAVPTWWTQLPDEQPLLTGWLGGPAARQHAGSTPAAITALGIRSLAAIFSTDEKTIRDQLTGSRISNWATQPGIESAYTYAMPGSQAARQLLNTPLDNTIFFCGEALYEGKSPGTVEAALTVGRQVAGRILHS